MQQGPLGNKKLCVDLRQSLYSLINLFKNQASVAQSRKLLLGVESWAVSSGSLCYHLQLDKAEWGPPSARAVILGQFPILQRQCLWDLAEITELGQALSSLDHHRRAISSSFEGRPNRWCLELGHQVPTIYTLFRDIEITTSGTKTRESHERLSSGSNIWEKNNGKQNNGFEHLHILQLFNHVYSFNF